MSDRDGLHDGAHTSPSLAPQTLLLSNHTTCSGAVVDVWRADHGDTVRTYALRRRCPLGPNTHPALRFLSLNDMVFVAVLIALLVPSLMRHVHQVWTWQVMHTALSLRHVCVLISCVAALWRVVSGLHRTHAEEVTALRGVGLQLARYDVFGTMHSRRFIDVRLIRALVIHDAYFRSQAVFFLSATVEGEAERVVLFEETLPRLAVLLPVLRGLRHILFEEPEEGVTLAEMEERDLERSDDSADADSKNEEDSDATDGSFSLPGQSNTNSSVIR